MKSYPDPWAPYEPTAADRWDMSKVAHLHRRAGFGANWADLHRDLQAGPTASVDRFLNPRAATADETLVVDSLRQGVLDSRDIERLKAWWLYRLLYGPDPLREKLTLFWHGHFATSSRKVRILELMLRQNELLRRHALGDFAALLTEIIVDPAMLIWLDGAGSTRAKPNENFAREFLELFTLGVGHYTEADIREAARAFTGWYREGLDGARGVESFHFDPDLHDSGVKTFLHQTGPWKPADIVRITLEQPEAATFLCRKLYRFFISENEEPGPDLIQPLAEEFRNGHYSVRHLIGVLLRSRHFYAADVRSQRIKCPVELCVSTLHALEVPPTEVNLLALAASCERQGQDLFFPPNVKGWDGGRTWLNSTTVLERCNWASDLVWGNADFSLKPFDPLAWARRHGIAPEHTLETLADLLVQDDLVPQARELILRTGRDGRADRLRKGLQLLLHCPEYQLA
jgi:uncharacterized protein (DUF1800 family)